MSGVIYRATCLETGMSYIGQTWHWPLRKRKHELTALKGRDDNFYFYNAIRVYGVDSFEWGILHDGIDDQDLLDTLEKLEIKRNKTIRPYGYNLRHGGSTAPLCDESLAKLAASLKATLNTPEMKLKYSEIQKEVQNRPEVKVKHHAAVIAAVNTVESKAKKTKSMVAAWADPVKRQNYLDGNNRDDVKERKGALKRGKTYEEVFGKEKADEIKRKMAEAWERRREAAKKAGI